MLVHASSKKNVPIAAFNILELKLPAQTKGKKVMAIMKMYSPLLVNSASPLLSSKHFVHKIVSSALQSVRGHMLSL